MTAVAALYEQRETPPHPPAPWFTSQGAEVGRCDAMSQACAQQRPYGHHAHGAGVDDEHDEAVRFLSPSTLRVALNDGKNTNLGLVLQDNDGGN
jgi:hypothetical protein